MEQEFTVRQLRQLVKESSNEFKEVLGPNVRRDNEKNHKEGLDAIRKETKNFDGGLEKELGEEEVKYEKPDDGNKTMLDLNPENKLSQEKKDDIKAQSMGYTSKKEQDNGIEKTGKHSDNFFNGVKKAGQDLHDREAKFRGTGLQHHYVDDKYLEREEMYESKEGLEMRDMIDRFRSNEKKTTLREHIKTVAFKKTAFINEEHMLSRIPDEFKKEGEQFKMRDMNGNEYLMEWKYGKGNIISHNNKSEIDESINRMKNLFNYKSSDSETTSDYRLNEGEKEFIKTLNNARKIKD